MTERIKTGRNSKLTPELQEVICKLVAKGKTTKCPGAEPRGWIGV